MSFTVHNIHWIVDELLLPLIGVFLTKKLIVVDLTGCNALTDRSVVRIAEECVELTSVNLSHLRKLTSSSVMAFAALHSLTSINFENSVEHDCEGLAYELCHLFRSNDLRSINIRHCGSDPSSTIPFVHFASDCSKIVTLVLNNLVARSVTDSDILELCHICPFIEDLTIDYLWCLTVQAIAIIGSHLKFMRILSCFGMVNSDLVALALGEIFSVRSSIDISIMRMEGVINPFFFKFSEFLESRILKRRQGPDPIKDHLALDHICSMEDAFDERMLEICCPTIRRLSVGWFEAILPIRPLMEQLATACFQSLLELNICCSNVADGDVTGFALNCNMRLQILRLDTCEFVSNRGMRAMITANHRSLLEVSIDSCSQDLRDEALLDPLGMCFVLRKFRVCRQANFTLEGVEEIKEICKKLRFLSVFKCKGCVCIDEVDCFCYETML